MNEKSENQKEFLRELAALSKKYGVRVGGCGCCGSPFLTEEGNLYVVDHIDVEVETHILDLLDKDKSSSGG